jgi:hypothetical protein
MSSVHVQLRGYKLILELGCAQHSCLSEKDSHHIVISYSFYNYLAQWERSSRIRLFMKNFLSCYIGKFKIANEPPKAHFPQTLFILRPYVHILPTWTMWLLVYTLGRALSSNPLHHRATSWAGVLKVQFGNTRALKNIIVKIGTNTFEVHTLVAWDRPCHLITLVPHWNAFLGIAPCFADACLFFKFKTVSCCVSLFWV